MKNFADTKLKKIHPYAWLWEPLEDDAGFLLRSMFGGKSVYLDGRMVLYFARGEEPWNGLCVCLERAQHAALLAEFPELAPHEILPKWLYLSEENERFESLAPRLVALAKRRDGRIGVVPEVKRTKRTHA